MKDVEITEKDIEKTLISLHTAFQNELFGCKKEDLEGYWHFKYNKEKSLVSNLYSFYDMLELYDGFCRRWEEHTNGTCCVVERVRDKYLIPKIKNFVTEMETANQPLNSERTKSG